MNQPTNWAEIFGRAHDKPPEQEVAGVCADPQCGHALKNHIRGWCIEDFLESKPYCRCGQPNYNGASAQLSFCALGDGLDALKIYEL